MLLAIDIGNSNIVIGGIDEEKIRFEARIATDRIKTSDQYGVEIKNMLDLFRCRWRRWRTASSPLWFRRSSTRCVPAWSR